MAIVCELEAPLKSFYATTIRRIGALGRATIPIQVIGLTPVNEDNTNPNRPCTIHHVFSEDKNAFLFDFPAPFTFDSLTYPYYLQNFTTDTKIALSDTDLAETFIFGAWDAYPNRSGIIIKWEKVLEKYGKGEYFFFIGEGDLNPTLVVFTDSSPFQFIDSSQLEFTDI